MVAFDIANISPSQVAARQVSPSCADLIKRALKASWIVSGTRRGRDCRYKSHRLTHRHADEHDDGQPRHRITRHALCQTGTPRKFRVLPRRGAAKACQSGTSFPIWHADGRPCGRSLSSRGGAEPSEARRPQERRGRERRHSLHVDSCRVVVSRSTGDASKYLEGRGCEERMRVESRHRRRAPAMLLRLYRNHRS